MRRSELPHINQEKRIQKNNQRYQPSNFRKNTAVEIWSCRALKDCRDFETRKMFLGVPGMGSYPIRIHFF